MKSAILIILLSLLSVNKVFANELTGAEWGTSGTVEQFFSFDQKGRVSGFAGCNRFFAGYEISDKKTSGKKTSGKLEISQIGATKKACERSVMKAEFTLFEKLQKVKSFERQNPYLILRDDKGKELLKFVWRDRD